MLNTFIYQLPVGICGLILGCATISNLFFTLHYDLGGHVFLWISIILILLFCSKCCIYPKVILTELKNRNVCATFPTLPMAILTIVYILYHQFQLQLFILNMIWWMTVVLQCMIICCFGYYHIWKKSSHHIVRPNTSWFVTFVGIGVISETSMDFNQLFGEILLYIATICFILIIPYILYRKTWQRYKQSQFPLSVIIAAPGALCFNAYLTIVNQPNILILIIGMILSQFLFLVTLCFIPKLYDLGFVPTFSALTFPWVTTALSLYNVIEVIHVNGNYIKVILDVAFIIETGLAILVVCFVLVNYIIFMKRQIIDSIKE